MIFFDMATLNFLNLRKTKLILKKGRFMVIMYLNVPLSSPARAGDEFFPKSYVVTYAFQGSPS